VLIIGHRGACGYRPDHTLESYQLAIDQGADVVEADVVITKDGELICRHDCDLGPSTDVAERFAERKRQVVIDGTLEEGWFAHDFTLAEIKSLRARQPLAFRDKSIDGMFSVPTFEEQLKLVQSANRTRRQPIGEDGRDQAVAPWLAHARQAGLKVVVYTFRNEAKYLAREYCGDPLKEYERWFAIGIDALFTDFPDTACQAMG
jgi:glycerophosphoryl diester phosphodiesterase